MASRTLELTVISAEDLRIKGRPIKKNASVTVTTDTKDPKACGSTSVDTEGGSYPSWNEKLELVLPYHARFIEVEVQRKSSSSRGIRSIGAARVPVSDIDSGYVPPQCLHFLSYRLRQRDGERNGIINISVRVKGGGDDWCSGWKSAAASSGSGYHNQISAAKCQNMGSGKEVAVGIPVSVGHLRLR